MGKITAEYSPISATFFILYPHERLDNIGNSIFLKTTNRKINFYELYILDSLCGTAVLYYHLR